MAARTNGCCGECPMVEPFTRSGQNRGRRCCRPGPPQWVGWQGLGQMATQRLGVVAKGGTGFGEQQLASIFAQQFEAAERFRGVRGSVRWCPLGCSCRSTWHATQVRPSLPSPTLGAEISGGGEPDSLLAHAVQ